MKSNLYWITGLSGVIINALAIMDKWLEVDKESDLKIYSSKYKISPIK